jgi:hypothetical protein
MNLATTWWMYLQRQSNGWACDIKALFHPFHVTALDSMARFIFLLQLSFLSFFFATGAHVTLIYVKQLPFGGAMSGPLHALEPCVFCWPQATGS